jgi:hypothetical protein
VRALRVLLLRRRLGLLAAFVRGLFRTSFRTRRSASFGRRAFDCRTFDRFGCDWSRNFRNRRR